MIQSAPFRVEGSKRAYIFGFFCKSALFEIIPAPCSCFPSLRVTTLLSVLGLVWRREVRGPAHGIVARNG